MYPENRNDPGGHVHVRSSMGAVIGLIVGAIAKPMMPGKNPGGIFITMAIGIAGAIGATYLGQLIGWYKQVSQPASSGQLLAQF